MTAAGFRRLALRLPEAVEQAHMGHPDFRVGNKIFATLGYPDRGWGMVKLTPDQQEALIAAAPAAFTQVKGAWGERGATNVRLSKVDERRLETALGLAWRNVAPAALAARHTGK